jgi:hypothetical protein
MGADPETFGRVNGALFASAFLAGLLGLFQVVGWRAADARLVTCGFPPLGLLASRFATVLAVACLAAGVSFGTLAMSGGVEAPLVAVCGLLLAAVTYGLFGVLIGSVLPREVEGSLVLVFVSDLDSVLGSGFVGGDTILPKLLPLHYPHVLVEASITDGAVAAGDVALGVLYVLVLVALVGASYGRRLRAGGASA